MNQRDAAQVRQAVDSSLKNSPTLLGSGDFHHASALLVEQFQDPLSVIIFDHHPDCDALPPRLGCGSWVSRVLERPNVRKVVLLGISSGDISSIWIETIKLSALSKDKLEIYPYSHKPTKVLFRNVPENISITLRKKLFYREIHWQELKEKNLAVFFRGIIDRIPTKDVYISIDKDSLLPDYALTNWEAGHFELNDILALVRLVKERFNIVGLDITGDYSTARVHGIIKTIFSGIDHPKDYTAKGKPAVLINSVNENTNIKILESLK